MLQEQWAEFEHRFSQADVRAQFSRIIADGGGERQEGEDEALHPRVGSIRYFSPVALRS